jgi:Uma2 family endonuclease
MDDDNTKLITADELLNMPEVGCRYELVDGRLRKLPFYGWVHGTISMNLAVQLSQVAKRARLGRIYGANAGFVLRRNPDTVLSPDVAFVDKRRVEEVGRSEGFFPDAPDLAVEILDLGETFDRIDESVHLWLKAGTRLVWVVDPATNHVATYRSLSDITTLTEKDTLDGGDVVPGFSYPVAELFII